MLTSLSPIVVDKDQKAINNFWITSQQTPQRFDPQSLIGKAVVENTTIDEGRMKKRNGKQHLHHKEKDNLLPFES